MSLAPTVTGMTSAVRTQLAVLTVVLGLLDATQTMYALTRPHSAYAEASPLPAAILHTHGLTVMVLVGLAATAAIAAAYLVRLPWPTARRVLWGGALLLTLGKVAVVTSNFVQLSR